MRKPWIQLWPYSASFLAIAAAATAAMMLGRGDSKAVVMLILVPVLWSAVRFGRTSGIFTAVLGSVAVNLILLSAKKRLELADIDHALFLLTYLLVAIVASGLASVAREEAEQHRRQAELARQRSAELSTLYDVSQSIAGAADLTDLKARVSHAVAEALGVTVLLELDADEECPGTCCVPVQDSQGRLGRLRVDSPTVGAERLRLLNAVAAQVAVAVRRARLTEEMHEARVLADTEKLRAALLSSISHDFRTPLGTIIGAATGLLTAEEAYGQEQRRSLLTGILKSAERLDRFTRNLLDITCIESGAVSPRRDWTDLTDVLGTALTAVEDNLERAVRIDIPTDLPLLRLDFVLIEHVFQNLLENAGKYSPPGSVIDIAVRTEDGAVVVEVFNACEEQPDAEHLRRLFDKFYRGASSADGSGLGLAICRGFMVAHGGGIEAVGDPGRGGIVFRLHFPVDAEQPDLEPLYEEA